MKLKRIVLGMVVITLFVSLTGCNQQTDKPFTIKETKITHKIILTCSSHATGSKKDGEEKSSLSQRVEKVQLYISTRWETSRK